MFVLQRVSPWHRQVAVQRRLGFRHQLADEKNTKYAIDKPHIRFYALLIKRGFHSCRPIGFCGRGTCRKWKADTAVDDHAGDARRLADKIREQ